MPDSLFGAHEPMALYRARRRAGLLEPDPAQQLAIEKLQSLHRALVHYRPEHGARGWLGRFGLAESNGAAPDGLYLCGPVGRGKSMLMDMFFATAPVAKKRRVHFHAFMLEVHDRIERERRATSPRADRTGCRTTSLPRRRSCASTSSRSTTSPTR